MARANRSRVEKADIKVAKATAPIRNHPATRLAGEISELADQPPTRAILAALIVAGAVGRDRRLTVAAMRMLATHQLATSVKSAIKHAVDRTRPEVLLEDGHYESGKGRHSDTDFNSFPSGHTAGAIAVARALGRDYPAAAVPALIGAIAVAAIQVPRGKHYVSDVLVGALIGFAADAVLGAVTKRLSPA